MHANAREDIQGGKRPATSSPWPSLKETTTGDTLFGSQCARSSWRSMEFPDPVIEIAVEPKSKADQEKMGVALARVWPPRIRRSGWQDGSMRPRQTVIKPGWANCTSRSSSTACGASSRSRPTSAQPQVAYRETIRRHRRDRLHAQEADGRFGSVCPHQGALPTRSSPASGVVFDQQGRWAATVPREFIPGGREGPEGCHAETGVLCRVPGRPTVSADALQTAPTHEVDSSALAFEIAARACCPRRYAAGQSDGCWSR